MTTETTEAERKALYEEGVARQAHYKTSRARETELARIQVKARVQNDLDARNIFYATLVDDYGFSVAEIGRIMGTTNRLSAKGAVEAGRALRPVHAEAIEAEQNALHEEGGKFFYNGDERLLTVRLSREDFTPYLAALPEEPSEDGEEFSFTYDGQKLIPVEKNWQHPVVAVMMLEQPQREAIAFIEGE